MGAGGGDHLTSPEGATVYLIKFLEDHRSCDIQTFSYQGWKIRSFFCSGNSLLWTSCPEVISLGIPSGKAAQLRSPTRLCRWVQNRQSCHLLMTSYKKGSESLAIAIFLFEVQVTCPGFFWNPIALSSSKEIWSCQKVETNSGLAVESMGS
jgi:hypothetical protein